MSSNKARTSSANNRTGGATTANSQQTTELLMLKKQLIQEKANRQDLEEQTVEQRNLYLKAIAVSAPSPGLISRRSATRPKSSLAT